MSHSVTKVAYEAFELVNAKLPPVKNIRLRDYAWWGFFVFRTGCLTMITQTKMASDVAKVVIVLFLFCRENRIK